MEAAHIFISGDGVDTLDAAGLTHTGLRCGRCDVTVLEFREILFKKRREKEYVLSQPALSGREIPIVSGHGGAAGDVDRHTAFVEHVIEPRTSEIRDLWMCLLQGKKFLSDRTALARTVDTVMVHTFIKQFAVRVNSGKDEAE